MIKIEKKDGYVVWSINLKDAKHKDEIALPEDVFAIQIEDGAVVNSFKNGIKEKIEKDKHAAQSILVCAVKNPLLIKWGVGQVPYRDYEAKIDAICGVNGDIKVDVFRLENVTKTLGTDLTEQDIKEKMFGKIKAFAEEIYMKNLEDCFGRPVIIDKREKMSNELKKKLDDYFAENGLMVRDVSVGTITVDEKYEEKRKEFEERKERKQEIKDDLDILSDINDAFPNNDKPEVVIKEVYKCPSCGKEIKPGERFCSICGRKI